MPSLDALLPHSGLPSGSLIEWISDGPGNRASSIAFRCAAGFLKRSGAFAIVDGRGCFNPAAIRNAGVPASRLLLVRPGVHRVGSNCLSEGSGSRDSQLSQRYRTETLWALEQLGRCSGVQVAVGMGRSIVVDGSASPAAGGGKKWSDSVSDPSCFGTSSEFMGRPSISCTIGPGNEVSDTFRRCCSGSVSVYCASDYDQRMRSSTTVVHGWKCHHETGHVLEVSELAGAAGGRGNCLLIGGHM